MFGPIILFNNKMAKKSIYLFCLNKRNSTFADTIILKLSIQMHIPRFYNYVQGDFFNYIYIYIQVIHE